MTVEEKKRYREYVAFKENRPSHKTYGYGSIGATFNKALLLPKKIKIPFKK